MQTIHDHDHGSEVVIVGGSVAAVRTAEALRQEGWAGPVRLISDEPHAPYDRPPLSKQFLAGTWDEQRIALLDDDRAAALDVRVELGVAAVGLDPDARRLTLADGRVLGYHAIVLATGATARPGPWASGPHLHTLRTRADSERLRDALRPGADVVVIGGGWIGAEVAATALARDARVTVVDVAANPYQRSVGPELGAVLASVHERHGVEARFGVGVQAVRADGPGAVVTLTDGSELPAAAVVVGIGAVPNTGWLASSGLELADGVACDDHGRVRGASDVYAVGDVARWGDRRHEHWTSAVEQARAVARTIVDQSQPVPSDSDGYVWSDQYDWKIQLAGVTDPEQAPRLVGDPAADRPRLAALWTAPDGRLAGLATVNWPKAMLVGRRAVGLTPTDVVAADLQTQLDRLVAVPT